jgi:hypothetical protein
MATQNPKNQEQFDYSADLREYEKALKILEESGYGSKSKRSEEDMDARTEFTWEEITLPDDHPMNW